MTKFIIGKKSGMTQLFDENGKEVKYTTQSRIMLNTELPRYQ